jgi:16S rRNA (adenine1518-N6/adenine1519-N6)-dimethyltransferase
MSTVVSLLPLPEAADVPPEALERVTQAAFGQRRKMLRQSLKALGDPEMLLAAAAARGDQRAEEIPVGGFIAMARALAAR